MAKIHKYTVQEILNLEVTHGKVLQGMQIPNNNAGDYDNTDPWSSLRCFHKDAAVVTAPGGFFETAFNGSGAGSGSLGGGTDSPFSSMITRVNNGPGATNGAIVIIADNPVTAGFPSAGVLYCVTYDSNKPIVQKLVYTGTSATQFTGVSGWVGTAGLTDNDVLSYYSDAQGTKPAESSVNKAIWTNFATMGLMVKVNDPDAPGIYLGGTAFTPIMQRALYADDPIEDLFFAYTGTIGNTGGLVELWS